MIIFGHRAVAIVGLLKLAVPVPAHAGDEVRVTGTGSALGTMTRLALTFEKAHPGERVRTLPSLGSNGAIRAVADRAIELGLAGRPLTAEEQARGLVALEIGRTPFLFAVGARTGATQTGAAELARLYRGELATWPSGERVRLVLRPASDADTLYLRSITAELAAAVDRAQSRPGMLMAVTNQECDELIAHTPGGIGPSTLAQLITEPRGLVPLRWEGVEPTVANLTAGSYTLSKPLLLVMARRPSEATRRFVAFVASPEGRRILEASGFQPLPVPPLE